MERGIPVSTPPYGYKLEKNENNENIMVVDEQTAPVIRRMVEMFLSGKSYADIAKVLNAEHIPTASQYRSRNDPERLTKLSYLKWKGNMIRAIFMNETYRGRLIMGKDVECLYRHEERQRKAPPEWRVFENHHEALISEEEYEQILELKPKAKQKKPARPNLFRGRIFCGKCGMAMFDLIQDNRYERYSCARKGKYGVAVCNNKNISKPQVYDEVLSVVKEQIQGFADMDELLGRLKRSERVKKHYESISRELIRTRDEADQVVSFKSGLYADLREGLIDENEYGVLAKEYSVKLNRLQETIAELEKALSEKDESPLDKGDIRIVIDKYRGKRTLSQDMVDAFVEKVIITDGNIEIVLKYEDTFMKLKKIVEERHRW
jgi:hypothetical protein